MDHLSSCYFCGTAMDDPLQDYRIVPVELRDSDAVATVTLCSSCHAKLERLLGPVVEAAGESGVTLDVADPHAGGPGREPDTGAGPDPPAGETASDGVTGDDELIEVDDRLGEDPLSTVDTGESDANAGESYPDGLDTDSGEGETDDDDPSGDGDDDTGGGADDDAGVVEDDDTGDEDVEGDADEDAQTSSEPTTRTTVSALEYNKVMRLLQNREFPVDRAEIQTVAANAYGLAEHECAEVIDLAIDRGLIDEHDGQLVRPE